MTYTAGKTVPVMRTRAGRENPNTKEASQAVQWEGREAGMGADAKMDSWLPDRGRSMLMAISLEGYAALVRVSLIPPRVRMLEHDWHKRRTFKIRNSEIFFLVSVFACSNAILLVAMIN